MARTIRRAVLRRSVSFIICALLIVDGVIPDPAVGWAAAQASPTTPSIVSPDPSSLPEWAAEPAGELIAAGLTLVSPEAPQVFGRGDFMALAVAASGRPTEAWVQTLRQESIVVGGPDGSIRPDDPITRGEAVAFLVKLLRAEAEAAVLGLPPESGPTDGAEASDITDHWSTPFFIEALRWGLVRSPPDGLLHPDDRLSVAEGLTLAARFLRSGEGLLPLRPDLPQSIALVRAAEAHVLAFTNVFSCEPYDFEPLTATCAGQARSLIAQNSRYYLDRYARGTRFKFELLSFSAEVTTRSLFLATVATRERMREYVDGKAEESEYTDHLDLRRVNGSWLIYR